MSEPLTIESFFLADYAKVKARNEELEAEIREVKANYDAQLPESGFIDMREPVDLVKVDTECSEYKLFTGSDSPFREYGIEQIRELIEMPDNELLEKMSKAKTGYYGYAIKIEEKRFPFTVMFRSYKGDRTYAYDPDRDNKTLVIFLDSEADTDNWVISSLKDECVKNALSAVRESCYERIRGLELQEAKEEA